MLTLQEVALLLALIALLGGWAMGRVGTWFGGRREEESPQDVNHRIRALEADLRVTQRKAEEAELALERHREETETLQAQARRSEAALAEREQEIETLQKRLADECGKTQNLRDELVVRAEETIRAQVRIKDAETELSVARAGSEAVLEQVQKLAAEREELTGRLSVLQAETGGQPRGNVRRLPLRDPMDR